MIIFVHLSVLIIYISTYSTHGLCFIWLEVRPLMVRGPCTPHPRMGRSAISCSPEGATQDSERDVMPPAEDHQEAPGPGTVPAREPSVAFQRDEV